ncbi:MAG: UDP-3-O-(3-hydroxymyristoyl)glucosamine N-acyltransferase [Polyangiaceae bacterium]|nr:UDP-3-O-(3-hydroxymyristoyl)glucosamine N-acyltransferase [Polyangiaceae bacterium]
MSSHHSLDEQRAVDAPRCGIELPQAETLAQLVLIFGGEVRGLEPEHSIQRLVSPQDATRGDDLLFVTHPRYLEQAAAGAGIALTRPNLASRLPRAWAHENPSWVLAQLLERAAESLRDQAERSLCDRAESSRRDREDWSGSVSPAARVAPSAVVHPGASLHASVVVEPGAVIFPRVRIEADVVVGAGSVVGRAGFGWAQGPAGAVRIPQLAGVILEHGVELGANCTIDSGCLRPTRIGRDTKLDAQVHVGHNAQLGQRCLIAAQCGFAGSCEVGNEVRMGGQSGVADHVRVGDRAQVAAKTGVIRDVPAGEVVAGFPAVSRNRWLRATAKLFSGR